MRARRLSLWIFLTLASAAGADDIRDEQGVDGARANVEAPASTLPAPTALLIPPSPSAALTPPSPASVANQVAGAVLGIQASIMTEIGKATFAAAYAANRVACIVTRC